MKTTTIIILTVTITNLMSNDRFHISTFFHVWGRGVKKEGRRRLRSKGREGEWKVNNKGSSERENVGDLKKNRK